MSERRVVMDANIAFKVLSRGRDDLVERLRPAGPLAETTLHAPRFLFVEIFKHKERLVRASRFNRLRGYLLVPSSYFEGLQSRVVRRPLMRRKE